MSFSNIDTNLENYSREDLMRLFDIKPEDRVEEIQSKTSSYINATENEDSRLTSFLQEAQNKLMDFYNFGLERGVINPINKKSQFKYLTIDSRFRQNNSTLANQSGGTDAKGNLIIEEDTNFSVQPNDETADFEINLSETLKNVVRLKFYSIHIPYSWYNINEQNNVITYGLTKTPPSADPTPDLSTLVFRSYIIPTGNYIIDEVNLNEEPKRIDQTDNLIHVLNNIDYDFENTGGDEARERYKVRWQYSRRTGKVSVYNNAIEFLVIKFIETTPEPAAPFIDPDPNTTSYVPYIATPFETTSLRANASITNSIGTLLGYAKNEYALGYKFKETRDAEKELFSEGFPNLTRTKYMIIEVDDYNNNQVAAKLVFGSERYDVPDLPNYYEPLDCGVNGTTVVDGEKNKGVIQNAVKVPLYKEVFPRKRTQKQIYALNEILKSRLNKINIVREFSDSPNYFSFIPIDIKGKGVSFGDLLVYGNDSEMLNERIYTGPVNINRLRIRVLDENGNLLSLNGAEWSMVIIVENLYPGE